LEKKEIEKYKLLSLLELVGEPYLYEVVKQFILKKAHFVPKWMWKIVNDKKELMQI
jgi:hypothetical protein